MLPPFAPSRQTASACSSSVRAAIVPKEPTTPAASGCRSETAPFPVNVVPTAAWSRSASRSVACSAPAISAPPPASRNGRSARASTSAAASISVRSGSIRPAGNSARGAATSTSGASASSTSCGRISATGPGRPVVASRIARSNSAGSASGSGTSVSHFVTGASSAAWSSPCEATPNPRSPCSGRGRSLTIASSGIDAFSASPSPDGSFAAPGPTVASHAARRPVTRA